MSKIAGGWSKSLQMFNRTIGAPWEVHCRGQISYRGVREERGKTWVMANKRRKGEQQNLQAEDNRQNRGRRGQRESEKVQIRGCRAKCKKRRKNLKDYYRDCSKNLKSRTKLTMKKTWLQREWRERRRKWQHETWPACVYLICPSKHSAGGFRHHSTMCSKKENARDIENETRKRVSKK